MCFTGFLNCESPLTLKVPWVAYLEFQTYLRRKLSRAVCQCFGVNARDKRGGFDRGGGAQGKAEGHIGILAVAEVLDIQKG
jgi:hypothetical protein